MKRLILCLTLVGVGTLAAAAMAGDYHTGGTLICTDCHIMHASQTHQFGDAFQSGIGSPADSTNLNRLDLSGGKNNVPATPVARLLRQPVNELCLSCHDGKSFAPDVYGTDNGGGYASTRNAGGLNKDPRETDLPSPGGNYNQYTGHSLGYNGHIPGDRGDSVYTALNTYGLWASDGLECTSCHAQHGGTTYRNLLSRGQFTGKPITYKQITSGGDNTVDVVEYYNSGVNHYAVDQHNYMEPNQKASAYANWCKTCHVSFHGTSGDATTVGGNSGGWDATGGVGSNWLRHPQADVDIGAYDNIGTPAATFVSSLTQWRSNTNHVKAMDANGLWTGASPSDTTLTASCFSCHKSHGNENPFGLIFMTKTGTVTDNGVAGGVYKDLCKNCHVQG